MEEEIYNLLLSSTEKPNLTYRENVYPLMTEPHRQRLKNILIKEQKELMDKLIFNKLEKVEVSNNFTKWTIMYFFNKDENSYYCTENREDNITYEYKYIRKFSP